MRKGINPQKNAQVIDTGYYHKVIVPVYIPNEEGYYRDAFKILKICLHTLITTIHDKTIVAVADNGSCDVVIAYLQQLYTDRVIQELSITRENVGKVNSIYKVLAGDDYPLVTLSDADVYFYEGWQEAIEDIYRNFGQVGAVCPTPSSKSYAHMTQPIWYRYGTSKKLLFEDNPDPKGMQEFAKSLGNPDFYNDIQLKKTLVLTNENGKKAVLGAGHYVATYRGEILKTNIKKATAHALGAKIVQEYIDKPVYEAGLYRLATTTSYASHMGNTYEEWMDVSNTEPRKQKVGIPVLLPPILFPGFFKIIAYKVIGKCLQHKKIGMYFLRKKGLSTQEAQAYH